jgi:glycine/D-amino acid oxidase-like deaminating enzyme/nitrite reductase/ring-hydroxylating ferredoxin subunit
VEHRSVWLATTEQQSYPSLQADMDVDVAVVGGGITGLTTALLCARDGARVALLEARTVGTGTSGKTTGKVTSQHSVIYETLISRHGEEKARQYADANQAGMHQVVRLADELGIDCHLTWASSYVYTQDASKRQTILDEYEAAQRLGLPARLETSTELPVPVEAAVTFDDQVHLHAGRYLYGLARGLTDAGAALYENTRVTDVDEQKDGVAVKTPGGTVRAQQVVLATLLPIRYAGAYFARARPTRSFGIALRLRGDAPKGMGITIDSPTRSTRPWLDPGSEGLIVVGNDYETGTEEDTTAAYQDLEDWARATFDVEAVDYRWSSQDFVSPDKIPYVGRAQLTSRTLVATGFAKWGLSNGTAAAVMLGDLIAERDNAWLSAFDATRVGGPRTIAGLMKDNLKVGKEFVGGHLSRLKVPSVDKLAPGHGGVVEVEGHRVGAYRDPANRVHAVSNICTHMGCRLNWNNAETSWDCPCHGSRFDIDGSVLDGPAVTPLSQVHVDGTQPMA